MTDRGTRNSGYPWAGPALFIGAVVAVLVFFWWLLG